MLNQLTASADIPVSHRQKILWCYGIVVLSGFAGLGYQMVWSRMLSVSLGHEIIAVLAVVAAFFVGLALGALLLNTAVREAARPQLWYAGLELVIGLWALLLIAIIPYYNQWVPRLIGVEPSAWWHWLVAFVSTLLLLLPATAAMGATLPAIERSFSGLWQRSGRIAGLYAGNTLGAVVGTLAATFVLIPAVGLTVSIIVLAFCNIICALSFMFFFKNSRTFAATRLQSDSADRCVSDKTLLASSRLLVTMFITGFLGIGYEILVVRLLSQVLENTVYTFAAVLSVYLLGVTIGAAIYQKLKNIGVIVGQEWSNELVILLVCTSLMCTLGISLIGLSDDLYQLIMAKWGPGLSVAIIAELAVAGLVFLLPTVCMGALFSHLAGRTTGTTIGLGKALGFNTLGAALAPFCFGVIFIPSMGAKIIIVLISVSYLLLIPNLAPKNLLAAAVAGLAAVLILINPHPLRFVNIADDSKIIAYDEGVMAAVAVVEDGAGHRHLKVNNHFTMGGTASRFSDHRQTHIPLLLHGSPQSALYLGLGTGITFEAAAFHPNLSATGVELIPESLPLMKYFDALPEASRWAKLPRLVEADARRFVLSSQDQFDVIIAEIFHPSRDGAGSLYTVEHFTAIKQRLAPQGLFCQWLPLFQLDLATLKTIIRTFIAVFPQAQLHLGHFSLQQPILCLVGSRHVPAFTSGWLQSRVVDRRLQRELVQARLNSDFALFGGYLGGREALAQFAGDGPLNTDNYPVVTYGAPSFVYGEGESQPQPAVARLMQLVESLQGKRHLDRVLASGDLSFQQRLESYWQARDIFVSTGAQAYGVGDIQQLLRHIQQPLLAALKLSSDFDPAYRTLLMSAQALYDVDPHASYQLLTELDAANPEYREARRLRYRLFGN